jgi:glycosyltransferase involved in cell wall biosynthesis
VRHEKPEILHGYMPVPNLLAVLLKPLFPRIRMVWGVRASNVDLSRYDRLSRVVFRLECFFSRFADLIIVNSHAGRDYHLKHGFPEGKMVVVHNGIDTERFIPSPEARSRVRKEWGIADNEKLIGIVARLDPMKDHPTFLKAASLLAKEQDNVRFVCVGDGPEPYKSELKRLSRELGLESKLIWAGAHSDMPAVYNAMDVAASSSFGEGFSNVIGEAMACGVPCVATDVGDSALIVGDAGAIAPPRNPEALARSLGQMLSIDKSAISSKTRKRIKEKYDLIHLIDFTESVLSSSLLQG